MDLIVRGFADKWTFKILKGMSVSFQDYQELFILLNYIYFYLNLWKLVSLQHICTPFFFLIQKLELLYQNANFITSSLPPLSLIHTSPSYLFPLLSQISGQQFHREAFPDPYTGSGPWSMLEKLGGLWCLVQSRYVRSVLAWVH